ncbi:ABC transporter permease subunit [Cryobacterium sp. CG_9.6]|uniref:ABC transporter permease n=1 Tax=Cryobacterium sp. CG_9.6 TaxID=2760710 RepID=UPI00247707A0|nr:ABC transporter permease subunit [Cryobacterium sp. CG_9.6]MDH6238529.1 ABC-2 type transport system permease protein [Cryobacterium sp. CG_9.6]
MSVFVTSARQEMLSVRRARIAHLLLAVFLGMVSVSSIIGWVTTTTVTKVYDRILADELTTAPNPFTSIPALYYARNSVIYVVLIGALMAIVLGVQATLRDRKSATTSLILSRPVRTTARLSGQLAGLGIVILTVLAISTFISWAAISIITGALLGPDATIRLIGFAACAWLLLMVFAVTGMVAGIYSKRETTALLVPFVLWSALAFVLPQLGTAARPVALLNPVPIPLPTGGYFDLVSAITGPLSVTEQFKRAASILLQDNNVTGDPLLSVVILIAFFIVAATVVVLTPRRRLRSALDN